MSANISSSNQSISQDTLVNPTGAMTVPLVDKTRTFGDQNVRSTVDSIVSNSTPVSGLLTALPAETALRLSGDAANSAAVTALQQIVNTNAQGAAATAAQTSANTSAISTLQQSFSQGAQGSFVNVVATGTPTSRMIADRFADSYDIKNYGATLDGTSDDAPFIQAAYNALPTTASGTMGNGVLNIPGGKWYGDPTELPNGGSQVFYNALAGTLYQPDGVTPVFAIGDGDVLGTSRNGSVVFSKNFTTSTNFGNLPLSSGNDTNAAPLAVVMNLNNPNFYRFAVPWSFSVATNTSAINRGYAYGIVHTLNSRSQQDLYIQESGIVSRINRYGASTTFNYFGTFNDLGGYQTDGNSCYALGEFDCFGVGPDPQSGRQHALLTNDVQGFSGYWVANTTYSAGYVIVETPAGGEPCTYICTTAGTTSGTQPTWTKPTHPLSATFTDGSVVWTYGTVASRSGMDNSIIIQGPQPYNTAIRIFSPILMSVLDTTAASLYGNADISRHASNQYINFGTPSKALPWVASYSYAAGAIVIPNDNNGYQFYTTTAGTSGTSEPAFSVSGAVTDGGCTWQLYNVGTRIGYASSGDALVVNANHVPGQSAKTLMSLKSDASASIIYGLIDGSVDYFIGANPTAITVPQGVTWLVVSPPSGAVANLAITFPSFTANGQNLQITFDYAVTNLSFVLPGASAFGTFPASAVAGQTMRFRSVAGAFWRCVSVNINTPYGVLGLDASGYASAGLVIADSAYLATTTAPRSLAARFGDVLNPADFGAPLNGTGTDQAGINAMIAAQPSLGARYTYPVGAQLYVTTNPAYSGLGCHDFNGATSGGVVAQSAGKDMFTTLAGGGLVYGRTTTNPASAASVLTISGNLNSDISVIGSPQPIWSPFSVLATTTGSPRALTALFGINVTAAGNSPSTTYVGGISNGSGGAGTILNVTSVTTGTLAVGQPVQGGTANLATLITAQTSGTTGGVGTYTVSISQLVAAGTNLGCGNTDVVAGSFVGTKSIGSREPCWAGLFQSNDRTPGPSSLWGGSTGIELDMNINGLDDAGSAFGFVPAGTGARSVFDFVLASNTSSSPNSVGYMARFGISGRTSSGTPTAPGTYNTNVYAERGIAFVGYARTSFIDLTMGAALPSSPCFSGITLPANMSIAFDGVAMSAATQTAPVHTMFYNSATSEWQFATSASAQIRLGSAGGVGFFGTAAPTSKPAITGAKGGNAALASVIAALVAAGFASDSTTA